MSLSHDEIIHNKTKNKKTATSKFWLTQYFSWWQYVKLDSWKALSLTVIIIGDGIGDTSSNLGPSSLPFTSH